MEWDIYLGHEHLDRADALIAAREQAKLNDLIVFIEAYAEQYAGLRAVLSRLQKYPNNWFLRSSQLAKPYIQFQLFKVEQVLASTMEPEADEPNLTRPARARLEETLRSLADCIELFDPKKRKQLNWRETGDSSRSVLLDQSSEMAKYLIRDSFGAGHIVNRKDEQEKAWRSAFDNAQTILQRFLPEAIPHVNRQLSVIIPVASTEPQISLSSTPALVQGVFLASWVKAKCLAECIVHEVSHDCLNRMQVAEPLLRYGSPRYYSPFRSDTRPASGLLHASYSFLNVIHYLHRVLRLEPRLAEWAADNLDRYLFNTVLCTRTLAASDELLPAGKELVSSISRSLDDLKGDYGFQVTKEFLQRRQRHFEEWAGQAEKDHVDAARMAFDSVIAETPVRSSTVAGKRGDRKPKRVSLEWLRENFQRTTDPVIVPSTSLVNKKNLKREIQGLLKKQVKVIDASQHKGYADTPSRTVQLAEHIDTFTARTANSNDFLVMKNVERRMSKTIWKEDEFFERFWIDGENSWMFFNTAGLIVPLHNDSVNNIHCIISGQKTFYLSPPSEEFCISVARDDSNAGFSAFNPFDDVRAAEGVGTFITIKEGDMLYLPKGWWHSIRYDSNCLAISGFDESTD